MAYKSLPFCPVVDCKCLELQVFFCVQNLKKFISCFKKTPLFFCFCVATLSNATNFLDESVRSDFDLFRIEGVYEIETVYTSEDGQRDGRIDRLVIYRNADTETFTVSLAMSKYNTTLFLFRKGQIQIEGPLLKVTAKGPVGNNVFGKIYIEFNRNSLKLSGSFRDSNNDGYKTFKGKPLYNLSMCLYQPEKPEIESGLHPEESAFVFPELQDLLKVYKEEGGEDLLILQKVDSDILTLVKKKALLKNDVINVSYDPGIYYKKYGVFAFNWEDVYSNGKVSVTYRIDDKGKFYLKMFSISSGGQSNVSKFYFLRELVEEELLPSVLLND